MQIVCLWNVTVRITSTYDVQEHVFESCVYFEISHVIDNIKIYRVLVSLYQKTVGSFDYNYARITQYRKKPVLKAVLI